MMSSLHGFISEWLGLLIANEAPVLFLVVALAGTLCCSIIWRLFSLMSESSSLTVTSVKRKRAKHTKTRRAHSSISQDECSDENFFCLRRNLPPKRQTKSFSVSDSTGDFRCSSSLSSHVVLSLQSQLFHLDRSYSSLSKCPERLGFLGSQLTCMNLSHNNLTDIPDEIGCLLGLEELYLGQNHLSCVPETFQNLRRLTELDLQNNRLTLLGDGLTKLSRLKLLLVNNNSITHLPADFDNLQNLEHLDLSFNSLCRLPDSLCRIFSLKTLNISNNRLMYLPDKMNGLIRLMHFLASGCQLVSIPRSICECAQLISVQLSRNRLQHLPDEIGQLFNLQFLSVDGNRLRYLPVTISSLHKCHIQAEDNCFFSPLPNSPVIFDMTSSSSSSSVTESTKSTSLSHLPSLGVVSLLEQSAFCILNNSIRWQHENLPQTLKDILTDIHYCICCKRPLLLWQQMQVSSQSFVSKSGLQMDIPLAQSVCPLQSRLIPCTFINI